MLSKIFHKTDPAADVKNGDTAKAKQAAKNAGDKLAGANAQINAAWQHKLDAAISADDDTALLVIANEVPSVTLKLAAIMALTGEESLKLAEREFRTHDRRVHRAAKQRYEMMAAQRETREAAAKLIDAAAALVKEAKIPANRLVELDRAWLALDIALLHPDQRDEFAALAADLTTLTRERGEQQLHSNRWTADAKQALLHLHVTAGDVAAGIKDRTLLTPATDAATVLLKHAPNGDAANQLTESLKASLNTSVQVTKRLVILDELLAPVAEAVAEPIAASITEPVAAPVAEVVAAQSASARWHALPLITDTQIASLLNARFNQWQRGQTDARNAQQSEKRQQANDHKKAVKHELNLALAELVQQAETTLAGGHLNEMNKHLVAIDEAIDNGAPAGALRGRIDAVQAEFARLKGWQHWGGGRARDDLVQAAEALAKSVAGVAKTIAEVITENGAENPEATVTQAAAEDPTLAPALSPVSPADMPETNVEVAAIPPADAIAETPADAAAEALIETTPPAAKPPRGKKSDKKLGAKFPPKFSIKQHADAIENLRERWKELDKLGGASSRSLWKRFDAALKIAYVPVAEHLTKLKAVRQENLAARNKLIAALDAVKLANIEAGEVQNYRDLSHALDHFQNEWRKCGPVEHTVPHKSREKLLEKMRAAMARLETPLQEARRVAQLSREQFIARAKTLSAEAAAKPQSRDIIPKIRELQSEWQQHAKTLPLARNIENHLWAEFKAATDSVFSQRDAAFSARDDEFKKHRQEREALIAKLAALHADTPAVEIKRTIADADTSWRRAGEVRRDDAAKIDARFRAARDAAQKHLAGSANRVWFATCDALNAKIFLCVEAEAAVPDSEIEARWQALPVLPALWEQSLKARFKAILGGTAKTGNAGTLDATLLQLESALDIPSPPASQAARRDLKLRALKATLEGKSTAAPTGTIEQLVAEAVGQSSVEASQRERLAAVLATVRERGHARG